MWRRLILVVVACSVGSLLATGAARTTDLSVPPPPPVLGSTWYVGGALNWVHHTGYVPIPGTSANTPWSADSYTFGGKVFGGYRLSPWIQFELAYHYLGEVTFFEGAHRSDAVLAATTGPYSHERSQALAASVMFFSPNLSPYLPWPMPVPVHAFARVGLAYKDILHTSVLVSVGDVRPAGDFHEGILSAVLGAGLEYRLENWFARLEYEYISTAIGGPPHPVPGLKGLWVVTMGGTNRAVNVMHTPLALTVGVNL